MKIKLVCEQTGLSDRTVRYYITEGLLSPSYTENYLGRKTFDFTEEDVAALNAIAMLRRFDSSIEEIRAIGNDPAVSPAVIAAVKARLCGEIEDKRQKEEALSHIEEGASYTVASLSEALAAAATHAVKSERVAEAPPLSAKSLLTRNIIKLR